MRLRADDARRRARATPTPPSQRTGRVGPSLGFFYSLAPTLLHTRGAYLELAVMGRDRLLKVPRDPSVVGVLARRHRHVKKKLFDRATGGGACRESA